MKLTTAVISLVTISDAYGKGSKVSTKSTKSPPKPYASTIARYPFHYLLHYRFHPNLESRRSLQRQTHCHIRRSLERQTRCHIRRSLERLKLKPNVIHVFSVIWLVPHVEQILVFASLKSFYLTMLYVGRHVLHSVPNSNQYVQNVL